MKTKVFCITMAGCMLAGCIGITADAASGTEPRHNNTNLAENYALWHEAAFDDGGLLKELLGGMNPCPDNYFASAEAVTQPYDSATALEAGKDLTLGVSYPVNQTYAMFRTVTDSDYAKIQSVQEAANAVLAKYFPNESAGSYYSEGVYFYVTAEKDKGNPAKQKTEWDKLRAELTEAGLIDAFYYPGQIFEHRELYIPYLTGYYSSKSPNSTAAVNPDDLQGFIDDYKLPAKLVTKENEYGFMYYVVPDEPENFESHFRLARYIRNELGILPYAHDDSAKSSLPQRGAAPQPVQDLSEFTELPLNVIEEKLGTQKEGRTDYNAHIVLGISKQQIKRLLADLEAQKEEIGNDYALFTRAFAALLMEKLHLSGLYHAAAPDCIDISQPSCWVQAPSFTIQEHDHDDMSYCIVSLGFYNSVALTIDGETVTMTPYEAAQRACYVIRTYGDKLYYTDANESLPVGGNPIGETSGTASAGDADCSGRVDISDAVLTARFVAEDKDAVITDQGRKNADVNGDGNITSDDGTRILQYIAKKISYAQMSASAGQDSTERCTFSAAYIQTHSFSGDYGKLPQVTQLSSRAELDAYIAENAEALQHSVIYTEPRIDFADAAAKYTKEWFETHKLLVVCLEEGSGSIRHEVTGVTENAVSINRLVPMCGTCDMAYWHILIELDKSAQISDDIHAVLNTIELQE